MKSSLRLLIFIVIVVIFTGGVFVWIFTGKQSSHAVNQTAQQAHYATPTMKVTDFSQGVPEGEKTVIIVRHSDSSLEKYILSTAEAAAFIKRLPPGDTLVSQTSGQ